MGGSTTTNTTGSSQSINEIPQWVQNAGQANYGLAQQVASQPLQQYQGQLVANVSPQMQQAWNLAANSGGIGAGAQNAAQAGFLTAANYQPNQITASQIAGTDLSPYMNNYTKDVINATLPIMQQNLALSQNQQQNAANAANAYGGSRQAIQQGVTQAQGAMGMGQMAAQLNAANFQQAMAAAGTDVASQNAAKLANQNAGLTANQQQILASSGLGTLGGQQLQNLLGQYGMLTSAGAQQEQQQQNDINAQIAKFQQAWSYPQAQLGMMESSLGMTPYNSGTSGSSASSTEQQTFNPAQIAGGAMSMLGSLFGGPAMGAGGLLNRAARGVTKVPGPRLSRKYEIDSQPYTLAPGEAVLNRHAAEHLGRTKIAKLNALQPKSALPLGYEGHAPRHYAEGASFVLPKVSPGETGQQSYQIKEPTWEWLNRETAKSAADTELRQKHYAWGTSRVPGFGRRDTVHAMLTPGEAVLTRHGASLLGRHNIAALNSPALGTLGARFLPPSTPGVARAIGMLGAGTPGRLSPNATPPSRSAMSLLGRRPIPGARRIPFIGALGG